MGPWGLPSQPWRLHLPREVEKELWWCKGSVPLVMARWSRLHLQALPRLGSPWLELTWPLPRCPVSQPGITVWARKWEEEEEAVPSSHQGDGGLGHSICWDALEATSSSQGCWQSTGLLRPSLFAKLAP